jgi:O-6-methylguanine DNA methyltransferase
MGQFFLYTIATPLGPLTAACTARGLCLLQFEDTCSLDMAKKRLRQQADVAISLATHPHLEATTALLNAYFEGLNPGFDIPLQLIGTPFQQQVWQQLQSIPYGSTMRYKQQAIALHSPKAIRAIAHANGANPIMIIIPCHRVLGSSGALTGYKGGLQRKAFLLQLEGAHPAQQGMLHFE